MRLLPLLLAAPLAACGVAGATGTSRDFAIRDFNAIELLGSPDVEVRVGGDYAVHAEGSPEWLQRLEITREGDTLVIGRRRGWSFDWGTDRPARVTVTLPRLAAARLRGSGNIRIDKVSGPAFEGEIRGSGDLSVGALAVQRAAFRIEGSGDLTARGTAQSLDVAIQGSGNLAGHDLQARSAQVSVRGSGDVTARVNGTAAVSVAGSGDVDLGSGARCTVSKQGSGDVRCG